MSKSWKPIAVAVAAVFVVGMLGWLVTDVGPWYRALRKPPWQPPDFLFGPVWTTIYVLVVVAIVRAWRQTADVGGRRWLVALFVSNVVVNVLWSLLFFRLQRPDWALLDVGVLWSSIVAVAIFAGRRDRIAGALLLPYLAWVSFASFLNLTIVVLNAPFAGR